jgi:hypothetical protein
MAEFDSDRIFMQAASTELDARMIETIVGDVLKLVHAQESDVHFGSAEYTFGWNFYILSVNLSVVRRLTELPDSDVLKAKGDSLEQKFVNWLNRQTKKKNINDKIHFSLLSDLKSSRYGLF